MSNNMSNNMSKKQFMFNWVKNLMNQHKFDYPVSVMNEVVDILLKHEKVGRVARLELDRHCVVVMDEETRDIFGYAKNPKSNQTTEIFMPKKLNNELFNALSAFKKNYKKDNEDCLFWHNDAEKFMVCIMEEHIKELRDIKKDHGTMVLKDCNIRTVKCDGEKFYRVTYIPNNKKTHSMGTSIIEMAFGHGVDGITYIFPQHIFKKHKQQILDCVAYEKTEFGKNTRWDITGKIYKKKK